MPGISGLAFWGFPLHPAGKPATNRAAHLVRISVPLLFIQGTRDTLAELSRLTPVISNLGQRATLIIAEQADHSFHVPVRSGLRDADLLRDLLDRTATWMQNVIRQAT